MIIPPNSRCFRILKLRVWSDVSCSARIQRSRTIGHNPLHFLVQRTLPSVTARCSSSHSIQSSDRPFAILGLQQIAIGSTNANQMSQLWHDIFGLPKIGTYTSVSENVSEDILQLGPSTRKISIPIKIDSIEGFSQGDWGISELEDAEELGKDVVLGQAQINVPFVEVDLMCPLDESKSPKVHVPPLNHIGLWVDDLKSSVAWMKNNGMLKSTSKCHDCTSN